MTGQRSPEERIALWLEEEAAGQLPDRTLEATFARTRAIRNRPGPSIWRPFPMSRPIATLLAVGAAAIILVVGFNALRPSSTPAIVGATPSPSVTPSSAAATPTPSICARYIIVGAVLAQPECRYESTVFTPTLTLMGAPLWTPTIETVRGLQLQPGLLSAADEQLPHSDTYSTVEGVDIFVVDRVAATPCQRAPRSDTTPFPTIPFAPHATGTGPADFFAWLKTSTPLTFATPRPVTVGSYTGLQTPIVMRSGSLPQCNDSIALTWSSDTPGDLGTEGMGAGQVRLTALDVHDTVVVIETWAPAARFVDVAGAVDRLVSSLAFR